MRILGSGSSSNSAASVIASTRSLSAASEALDTSSRRKISLLPYKEWTIRSRSWLTSAWNPRVSRVVVASFMRIAILRREREIGAGLRSSSPRARMAEYDGTAIHEHRRPSRVAGTTQRHLSRRSGRGARDTDRARPDWRRDFLQRPYGAGARQGRPASGDRRYRRARLLGRHAARSAGGVRRRDDERGCDGDRHRDPKRRRQ